MKHAFFLVCLIMFLFSCARPGIPHPYDDRYDDRPSWYDLKVAAPGNAEEVMPINVTGKAYNQNGGATLVSNDITLWIEGLHAWSDAYNEKKVRVWGNVVLRNDNPVFLDTVKAIPQGIPVSSENELESNKTKYWILDAEYELARK